MPNRVLLAAIVLLLGASLVESAGLTVSWTDNTGGEATTRLERRSGISGYGSLADVAPGLTEYLDDAVTAGTLYCYRALAILGDLMSDYSSEACASAALNAYALAVVLTGRGAGLVTSSPPGIVCGKTCSDTYVSGTLVMLDAAPSPSSRFVGWGGACSGAERCAVSMTAAVTVTADFDKKRGR